MQALVITQVNFDEFMDKFTQSMKPLIKEMILISSSPKEQKTNLTKREAAEALCCSVPMIDKLLQHGRLEKIKVGAKVLIPRTSIDKILSTKKG